MRRLLKGLAVLAVLLAGAATAVVIHRLQAQKDVRGSSSVEFVTTTEKTEPLPQTSVADTTTVTKGLTLMSVLLARISTTYPARNTVKPGSTDALHSYGRILRVPRDRSMATLRPSHIG